MKKHFLKRLSQVVALCVMLFLNACDFIEYSPNQIVLDDAEQDVNEKNIEKLTSQATDDTIKFILMGDTQRFYAESDDFVKSANGQKNLDFVIHTGDISDFGLPKEFQWVNEIMSGLKVPYMTVIGNHDLLANGPAIYKKMFGPYNFTFTYSGVKFICFDSNSREYGFDGSVPDVEWISRELSDTASFDQAVLVSHVPPFDVDADSAKEEMYAQLLANNGKVNLSLHGHQHKFTIEDHYEDGITYVVATTVGKRGYALIKLYNGTFSVEKVFY